MRWSRREGGAQCRNPIKSREREATNGPTCKYVCLGRWPKVRGVAVPFACTHALGLHSGLGLPFQSENHSRTATHRPASKQAAKATRAGEV
jgi:hypothetical protein